MTIQPKLIEINGHMVRFFPSPVNPDSKLLWVDVDSLARAFRPARLVGRWRLMIDWLGPRTGLECKVSEGGQEIYLCHYASAIGFLCASEDVVEQDGYPKFIEATMEMLNNV